MPGNEEPYSIGASLWPGISKLVEECGELLQVCGKLQAYPDGDHPDGAGDLVERLCDEMGDVFAALAFVRNENELSFAHINRRRAVKLAQFEEWHHEEIARRRLNAKG
jgi:NTP pyrophosphatase (non-canonical NTP hydrolase)